jgi:hypothetical protein
LHLLLTLLRLLLPYREYHSARFRHYFLEREKPLAYFLCHQPHLLWLHYLLHQTHRFVQFPKWGLYFLHPHRHLQQR